MKKLVDCPLMDFEAPSATHSHILQSLPTGFLNDNSVWFAWVSWTSQLEGRMYGAITDLLPVMNWLHTSHTCPGDTVVNKQQKSCS